jgi:hypothetical protein
MRAELTLSTQVLTALLRKGWSVKRIRGSHRMPERPGTSNALTSEAWKKYGRRVGRMNAENTKSSGRIVSDAVLRSRPSEDHRIETLRFFFECRDGCFNLIFRLSEKLEPR